jgi:hypothetical protein
MISLPILVTYSQLSAATQPETLITAAPEIGVLLRRRHKNFSFAAQHPHVFLLTFAITTAMGEAKVAQMLS